MPPPPPKTCIRRWTARQEVHTGAENAEQLYSVTEDEGGKYKSELNTHVGPAADTGFGGGGARMVGVAGGGVGFWPDTKSRGGGGCCRFMARYEGRGGGGGGGSMIAYRGGPGYSTVVEFMRADINRQRNRAAIL